MGNRMLVVGDIHGAALTFNRMLDVIGLERTDELYLLGDYIDRLDNSCGVIETILQLQKNDFQVFPTMGNHEALALRAIETNVYEDYLDWEDNGGGETLASYGIDRPQDLPLEHIEFLKSLPLYRVTDQYVFVHAGLDWELADVFSKAGEHAMLWSRSPKVTPSRIGGRTLVTGHTPQTIDTIRMSLSTKHIRIDNGNYLGERFKGKGSLVMVDLNGREVISQKNIDMAPADPY